MISKMMLKIQLKAILTTNKYKNNYKINILMKKYQ